MCIAEICSCIYTACTSNEKLPFVLGVEIDENPAGNELLRKNASELLENEMFLMFAKERPVIEVTGMLPAEIMPLIRMVIAQCNENPV